ncbi:MAG: hypothetical protein IBX72_02505 [Nitrospirae bacterium]|jgi:polynucleotide 5'-hydroxyl-kinase GRC3/NOL9|nr:hypothetical protein [Nitrospirota bacterium]
MTIIPEQEWESISEELKSIKGPVMIIGATDSGKSSFAKFLLRTFIEDNLKISLVDSDVGQSSIGLPGTISMKVFRNEKDLEDFSFERMSYVGTVNPGIKIPLIIDTTKLMTEICMKNSEVTLLDTSGLVAGEIGKNLKISKIKTIKPEYIIAIQREQELEHILELVGAGHIRRIRVSRMARARNKEERIQYRKKKSEDYFSKGKLEEYIIFKKTTRFFYNGNFFNLKSGDFPEGTLIGLNHYEETLSLGVITETEDDCIIFKSPVQSLKNVNKVVFGDIIV